MSGRRVLRWLVVIGLMVVIAGAASPWLVRAYWSMRSSNPVRRGVARATELGCFHCHGPLGRVGIPDPGEDDLSVPSWSGGTWMMYVENDDEIREWILDGTLGQKRKKETREDERSRVAKREAVSPALHEPDEQAGGEPHHEIWMPPYRNVLSGSDLEDLVAAFKVLSGMSVPPAGGAARRGLDYARRWDCFACHGAAGSGGLANPGSFTGFMPGWYGADFEDLVRDRKEFDTWIRRGTIPRLENKPIARYFMRQQKVSMPEYENITDAELDDLWAYARWLAETDGGHVGAARPW